MSDHPKSSPSEWRQFATFMIPIITLWAYLASYVYEKGRHDYYEIPNLLIDITLGSILKIGFVLVVILASAVSIGLFSRTIDKDSKVIGLFRWLSKKIHIQIGIHSILFALILWRLGPLVDGFMSGVLVALLLIVAHSIVFLGSLFINRVKRGIDSLKDSPKESDFILQFVSFITVFSFVIVVYAWMVGLVHAQYLQEEYFTFVRADSKYVLISTYRDSFVFSEIQKWENAYKLTGGFQIVPADSVDILRLEKTGKLLK